MTGPVIYAIQAVDGGPIKIGYCSTAELVPKRVAALQTGNPFRLVVRRIAPAPDGINTERDLHNRFARYRLQGEWFMDCPEVSMFARTGAKRTADGTKYAAAIESAYAAGRAAGLEEAEQTFRHNVRYWAEATLSRFLDEEYSDVIYHDEVTAAEESAAEACRIVGIPYRAPTAHGTAHDRAEAA
jgi:hypothetical protein